ncbi:hypothetical protein AUR66_16835 [Haloferax profundi]|uniref:Uncharacterized protein n=1 Tax=Haloferax profundi TaxID=1544718 RepID=A0A0W1S932_9EURY|nr:hypothetical protein AUR66_16835 [Haloferax profundi]
MNGLSNTGRRLVCRVIRVQPVDFIWESELSIVSIPGFRRFCIYREFAIQMKMQGVDKGIRFKRLSFVSYYLFRGTVWDIERPLGDDWPLIQIGGDVVSRHTGDSNPLIEGL